MGQLVKYSKSAAMSAAAFVGESRLFLLDYLLRVLRVLLLLAVWRTLFAAHPLVGGMTLAAILTYTLVAEAFADILACQTDLQWSFWDGTITMRFLRPLGVPAQYFAEICGVWAVGLLFFSLPLLLLAPLLGVDPRPASAAAGLLSAVSLALSLSVGMALETFFVAVAVGLELQVFAISRVRSAIHVLCSGAFLPLALLPWSLGRWFDLLPFAAMASAPMRIYTGAGDPLRLLIGQAVWALLLWPLALLCWRKQTEKMVSFGG